MAKKEEITHPPVHRINGAVTGTPLYSCDKQTYHSTEEIAISVWHRQQKFWSEMEKEKVK